MERIRSKQIQPDGQMNEKEFLELSDRERDGFIDEHVFGYKWYEINSAIWDFPAAKSKRRTLKHPINDAKIIKEFYIETDMNLPPEYHKPEPSNQSWQGMGKGIEHANENGYAIDLMQVGNPSAWGCEITYVIGARYYESESIFLAFWIAYLKVLGVISEESN